MEDSLYWIAYATQPSNIKLHSVDPSPLIMPAEREAAKSGEVDTEGMWMVLFCSHVCAHFY